ncbi:MAG: hypothetical protein M5U09_06015 [Gammaproteobacteria bacterium]|nr:hypothetical protein [Gammaproteobacteria bacterium]
MPCTPSTRAYSGAYEVRRSSGVCELAAEVAIDGTAARCRIKWGGENLMRRFHHRGIRLPDGSRQGRVRGTARRARPGGAPPVLRRRQPVRRVAVGPARRQREGRVLLVANADSADVDDDYRRFWPEVLERAPVVYGAFETGGRAVARPRRGGALRPRASCEGGPRPAP